MVDKLQLPVLLEMRAQVVAHTVQLRFLASLMDSACFQTLMRSRSLSAQSELWIMYLNASQLPSILSHCGRIYAQIHIIQFEFVILAFNALGILRTLS